MDLTPSQSTAIKETSREVLTQLRPSEVMLIEQAFDQNKAEFKISGPLGFGTGMDVVLWVYPLLGFLKTLAGTSAKSFAKEWGEDLAKHLWHDESSTKTGKGISLDAKSLDGLRQALMKRLEKEGVKQSDIERAGQCLVSVLIAKPGLLRNIVVK
jgi:hypothetical protein